MSNTTSTIDILDGRRLLGHVLERDGGKSCEAVTATGAVIGVFTSPAKAARAVYEVSLDQQHGAAA